MTPKKVLLVDTNFSSRPIYDAILGMGYEVHVVGGNPNDALAKTAEHYWELDYSNVEKLKGLVKREGFDYIVPGCTDRSYTSCSMLSAGDFPGIESIGNDQTINLKNKFRNLCKNLGLVFPRLYDALISDDDYPVIIKPVDSFSGKGITIVESSQALNKAIEHAKKASPTESYLIEEYVDGQLYSHSAFIEAGKVVTDFVVREDSSVNPFAVDTSTICSEFSLGLKSLLRASIEQVSDALCLKDGLIHTQFILKNEQVYLVEMTRRCPGDLYSQLIELQTGYPYVENYIRPFVNLKLKFSTENREKNLIIRHTVSSKDACVFNKINYQQTLVLTNWVPLLLTGDLLLPSPSGRVGIAFVKCENNEDQAKLYNCFLERTMYKLL